jgi:hypothetical protein
MKKNLIIFISLPLILSCKQQSEKKDNGLAEVRLDGKTSNAEIIRMPISADNPLDTNALAKISFEETVYDFGTVKEGAPVNHTFKFKNTGKAPLLITDIRTTCGCTVPEWNKKPILPDASDAVNVKFDTKGKTDKQEKKITILANTIPSETVIILRGVVSNTSGVLTE